MDSAPWDAPVTRSVGLSVGRLSCCLARLRSVGPIADVRMGSGVSWAVRLAMWVLGCVARRCEQRGAMNRLAMPGWASRFSRMVGRLKRLAAVMGGAQTKPPMAMTARMLRSAMNCTECRTAAR